MAVLHLVHLLQQVQQDNVKNVKAQASYFMGYLRLFIIVVLPVMYICNCYVTGYDACGVFRAMHLHTPGPIFAYRGIKNPLLCSHIGGGSQSLSPAYEQA